MNIYKHCIKKGDRGYVFVPNQELTENMKVLINTINNNSLLPMNILTAFDATKVPSNGKFIRNYMSLDYYYDNYEVKFAGYPTDEHDFHLTNIEFETERYNLFGITINDKKDAVVTKLHSFGFNEMPEKCSKNYLCFSNLDVRIGVQLMDDIVSRVVVSVATYYLGNRMY